MKKKFYDIIPQEKRSIRNIPLPLKKQEIIQDSFSVKATDDSVSIHTEHVTDQTISVAHHPVSMDGVKRSTRTRRKAPAVPASAAGAAAANDEDFSQESEDFSQGGAETASGIAEPAMYEGRAEDFAGEEDESFDAWSRHNKGKKSWKLYAALGAIALFALFFLSVQYASATIRINPVTHEVAVNSSRMYLNEVAHRVVEVEASVSATAEAKGTMQVSRKATGRVVLYNAFSSTEQRLVINTRLETPEGLVFKTDAPVTIPGQKMENGKAVPGSVEVNVTADVAGDKYNVGFKDFKLVAYRGSDRYDAIYGRTKTSIGNGYVGEVPNVATAQVASTSQSLRQELLAKLKAEVLKEVSESKGEVFIEDAIVPVYEALKQEVSQDGAVLTMSQKATAKAIIFNRSEVSEFLIKTQNQEEQATSTDIVYTGNLSKLFIKLPTDTIPEDLTKDNAYVMTSGTSTISSSIDTLRIAKAVSGLTREQAIPAIKQLVELESIEVSIKPWWKSKLPAASKRVFVEIEQ